MRSLVPQSNETRVGLLVFLSTLSLKMSILMLAVPMQGALAALNSELDQPIPMNRFRPNVVVDDKAPWAEDSWDAMRISSSSGSVQSPAADGPSLVLRLAAPASRCSVSIVSIRLSPSYNVLSPAKVSSMSSYRRYSNVLLGQLLCPDSLQSAAWILLYLRLL